MVHPKRIALEIRVRFPQYTCGVVTTTKIRMLGLPAFPTLLIPSRRSSFSIPTNATFPFHYLFIDIKCDAVHLEILVKHLLQIRGIDSTTMVLKIICKSHYIMGLQIYLTKDEITRYITSFVSPDNVTFTIDARKGLNALCSEIVGIYGTFKTLTGGQAL